MKYPCDLIRDLLPLYQDGVCSEESRAAVEEHLRECPSCRAYQTALCEADGLFPVPGEEPEQTADQEFRKAASLRAVRKTLLQRQVLAENRFSISIDTLMFRIPQERRAGDPL